MPFEPPALRAVTSAAAPVPQILEDRVALVTGAGSGLGRAIAEGLARAGARVALVDLDLGAAEETHARIAKAVAPHHSLA
ncbi:MAG: SDR family NAD(P)-dependent oxidoreductase, partial [Phycisphaerae bacterium]